MHGLNEPISQSGKMERKTVREVVVVVINRRCPILLLPIRTEVNGNCTGNQSIVNRKSRGAPLLLRSGSASRRWLSVELGVVVLVALVSMAADAEIRQLSPCKAVVNGYVYNLQPLMRVDGHPRFTVEAASGLWNYSFNPCKSFNLPLDPHEGKGDQCHYVAICQWCRNGDHFSFGLQRNARFIFYRSPSAKLPPHSSSAAPESSNSESHKTSSQSESAIIRTLNSRQRKFTFHSLGGAQTTVTSQANSTGSGSTGAYRNSEWDLGTAGENNPENPNPYQDTVTDTRSHMDTRYVSDEEEDEEEEEEEGLLSRSSSAPSSSPGTGNANLNVHKRQTVKGVPSSAVKSSRLDRESGLTGDVPDNRVIHNNTATNTSKKIPAIVFKGIRSKARKKVTIDLICDLNRVSVEDGLLLLISDTSDDKHFELHHKCCCSNACLEDSLPGHSPGGVANNVRHVTSTFTSESEIQQQQPHPTQGVGVGVGGVGGVGAGMDRRPRFIWLILVINAAILVVAVFVAGVCCRKGGMSFVSTGVYGYIPAGVHSSHLTMDSTDLEGRYVSSVKLTSPDFKDYGSSAQMSRAPVLENCVISAQQLEVGQRLGGSIFSDTYLADWKKRRVAIKRITVRVHQNQLTEVDSAWIVAEVHRLSRQRHRTLVAVLGVCIETRQPYVINELIEGDSLKEKILRMEIEQYPWYQRIKLCQQVADGMAYLHSAKTPVLHRDLRAANILIDQYGKAKIVDFGLTRIIQRLRSECDSGTGCYCQKERNALPVSVRWSAPEVMRNPVADEEQEAFGTPCDVYSFAMVCWEMASYKDPFDDTIEEQVMEMVLQGVRPPVDALTTVVIPFRELMKTCWAQNPETRPTFKQISVTLKSIQQFGGRFSTQMRRKRTNSESTNYLRSALNVSET